VSALPGVGCPWCAKEQPANANLALCGVATRDPEGAWLVRAISERGVSDREWIVDDVAQFVAADTVVVEGEGASVIIEAGEFVDDWKLIADEAGKALADARQRLDLAMKAAELVARCAIDDGLSEVELARRVGVDRMTVRKWQGKL
jgi:hypothetical protein